jgi:hypothetical protein
LYHNPKIQSNPKNPYFLRLIKDFLSITFSL